MIRIENNVIINENIDKVFEVSVDFERYPEFLPIYKEVKILEKQGDKMIVERKSIVGKKEVKWRSSVIIEPNKSIIAEQLEGPIPGMKIEWLFEEIAGKTKITLIHNFEYKKIPVIGHIIGKLIVAKIVCKMAEETLRGIKAKIEERK